MNYRLSGVRGALFPNMHLQLPTRVVYINGFKGLRQFIDQSVQLEQASNPTRIIAAITPGIIMTPVSSLLESYNAAHQNPEPILKRASRGYIPRTGREIIFGVGLNQLSDYCEERVPAGIESPLLKNALGSMAAGVISGYISHVPHNMGTLKMLNPTQTYMEIFNKYADSSRARVPSFVPKAYEGAAAKFLSILLPKGLHVRTGQIVGSYIILNGIINALQQTTN